MRLKTIIFSIVLTALVSCVKEEYFEGGGGDKRIDFDGMVDSGAPSKVTDAVSEGGFDLWAYKHTGSWWTTLTDEILLDNTGYGYARVTSPDGTSWNYGEKILWPAYRNVSFFAYAPSGAVDAVYAPGAPTMPVVTLTVPYDAPSQVDLLIAEAMTDRVGPETVTETFHHAMSRIELSAFKSTWENENVAIQRVAFRNLFATGSAALDYPVSWDPDRNTAMDFVFSENEATLTKVSLTGAPANIMHSDIDGMYLLPQSFARGGNEAPVEIEIIFTINDKDWLWRGPIPSNIDGFEPDTIYKFQINVQGDMIMITCAELESTYPGDDWNEGGW